MNKLKPCPFCGGEAETMICDSEGNIRSEDYAEDPWSGLGYMLSHDVDNNPNCPIANFYGESLGSFIYNTEKEAVEDWNRRV